MIIGIDARPLSYPLTGIGTYLTHLLDHLQRMDRRNRYVLMSNAPIRYRLVNPKWRLLNGEVTHKIYSTAWYLGVVPRLAIDLKLDLFWGPRHHLPLWLPRRVRTVLTVHDVVHRLLPGTMTVANRLTETALMGASVRRADRIAADSLATAAELRRQFRLSASKVTTVYPGVPGTPETPAVSKGDVWGGDTPQNRFFLFVGTMDPRKNLLRVLDGFEMAAERYPDVDLVIAGGAGWKNRRLMDRIRTHSAHRQIRLTGYVSRFELGRLYRQALALVFPSLYEGFGLPVVEAMAAGLPVIGSNGGALAEVIGGAGLKANPYDSRSIGRAMCQLIASPSLQHRLAEAGRLQVQRYSWDRCAQTMLTIFDEARRA